MATINMLNPADVQAVINSCRSIINGGSSPNPARDSILSKVVVGLKSLDAYIHPERDAEHARIAGMSKDELDERRSDKDATAASNAKLTQGLK